MRHPAYSPIHVTTPSPPPRAPVVAVLAQVDPLPRAEGEGAVADRERQVLAGQRGLDVGRHVVGALQRAGPVRVAASGDAHRRRPRSGSRRDCGRGVLVDGQRGGRCCSIRWARPTRTEPSSGSPSSTSRVIRWKPRERASRAISCCTHTIRPYAGKERGPATEEEHGSAPPRAHQLADIDEHRSRRSGQWSVDGACRRRPGAGWRGGGRAEPGPAARRRPRRGAGQRALPQRPDRGRPAHPIYDQLPMWAFHAITVAATIVASLGVYAWGSDSIFSPLPYLWVVVYACWFFRPAAAALHVTFVAVCFAVVLIVEGRDSRSWAATRRRSPRWRSPPTSSRARESGLPTCCEI